MKIIVKKSLKKLLVYKNGEIIEEMKISLGKNPIGKKQYKDDGKTPEGKYLINGRNDQSDYHKNLSISYPNSEDVANALKHGKSAGGDIKIHGIKNGMGFLGIFNSMVNWTDGCIAVRNKKMDFLFKNIPNGTEIVIEP